MSKLPPPVKKAIPIAGTTASLLAADAKRQEAMAAAEEGRPIVAALRGAQAVEEVVSPLPFTTGDVEDLVVTERTPQEEEFLRAQRETRAERMGARRERAASAQMDALMSK